jgi:glycosyltransferase involved in cell wall biosynthesis
MDHKWSVGVVIPAKNEALHIGDVLLHLPKGVDLAVVVDDRSTDDTAQVARNVDAPCEVVVLSGPGEGVGAAIDTGHQYLLGHLRQPFVSVVMAGDGQMNPNDMDDLLEPILAGRADHVKGNRKSHPEGFNRMPVLRQWASSLLAFFTTLAAGQRVQDPQCGYTATSSEVLNQWPWERSWKGYGYPNFWLINLSKAGWRIEEKPVQSIYRNETSGIKRGRFFVTVGWMMAREHHRRNLAWLKPPNLLPHTLFALFAYLLGWSALLPMATNDLEAELGSRGIPMLLFALLSWTMAHLFDRLAVRTRMELRLNAKT